MQQIAIRSFKSKMNFSKYEKKRKKYQMAISKAFKTKFKSWVFKERRETRMQGRWDNRKREQ
jgi:hypothetical protein